MRQFRWPVPGQLRRPEQGWSSLVLLTAMLAVVGLSVADSRPVALGPGGMGVLAGLMVAAGLVGYLLARSPVPLIRAHGVAAAAGAAILLLVASSAAGDGAGLPMFDWELLRRQLEELGVRVEVEASRLLRDAPSPPTTITFLVLGGLCWATAQFSAFSVFRHGRAGPAVMATGALLFLNEALPALVGSADRLPALPVLATFACLAMLLLMRLQLTAQVRHWARRHISDGGEVSRLFLRSGTLFVALTVAGATSLTAVAVMPAQRLDPGSLEGPLDDLREGLSRWLAVFAVDVAPRPTTRFDDRLKVEDVWEQGSGVAFVAQVEGGLRGNYWWLSAYADFDGHYWNRPSTSEEQVPASQPIAIPPDASGAGPLGLTAMVTPRRSSLALGTVVGPSEPLTVSRDVRVRSLGDRAGLSEITFQADVLRGGSYTVLSQVHDYEVDAGSLTASELRAAGVDYPSWIGPYVQVNQGASGPRTAGKAGEIARLAASLGMDNPYDKARLLQDDLRNLEYATSVEGLCRAGENVPECLLRSETGFCQHYATTMVMVLRELEIPARLVNGYLPGLQVDGDRYEVPMQALHAWPEVYFPSIGWVRFDPTPGGQLGQYQQQPTRFEEGEPSAFPIPSGEPPPDEADASAGPIEVPSPSPGAAGAPSADGGLGGGDAIVASFLVGGGVALLLLATSMGILYVWLRRLPGSDAGVAYTRIISLASRLGHGPHPSQTEYEYAASLSVTLPSVREELYTVARAHVEQRYGRRGVAAGQLPTLRRAYARIRSALLRLGLRART